MDKSVCFNALNVNGNVFKGNAQKKSTRAQKIQSKQHKAMFLLDDFKPVCDLPPSEVLSVEDNGHRMGAEEEGESETKVRARTHTPLRDSACPLAGEAKHEVIAILPATHRVHLMTSDTLRLRAHTDTQTHRHTPTHTDTHTHTHTHTALTRCTSPLPGPFIRPSLAAQSDFSLNSNNTSTVIYYFY